MPNMNGYQLATTVRELSRTIPIIGVTAMQLPKKNNVVLMREWMIAFQASLLTVLKDVLLTYGIIQRLISESEVFHGRSDWKFRYYSDKYCHSCRAQDDRKRENIFVANDVMADKSNKSREAPTMGMSFLIYLYTA